MTAGIVLLEGADAAGKTTLARYLVEHHGARYLHGTVNRDQWRYNLGGVRYAIKLALACHLAVMDRNWLSELCYGEAYRGATYYDFGARVLDRALRRHGAVVVMCVPTDLEAQARRWANGRAAGKREHFDSVREVIAMYADLYHGNVARGGNGYLHQLTRFGDFRARDDVIRYDLDRQGANLALVAQIILGRLRTLRRTDAGRMVTYRGENLTGRADVDGPRYLFVGATPGGGFSTAPRWPFADRDTNPSSATWLNRAIHHLALDESLLEIVNAIPERPEHGDYLPELLERAGRYPQRVIALGRVAERRLVELGSSAHRTIPHPQYHRRFHNGDGPAGYAELLREAIR